MSSSLPNYETNSEPFSSTPFAKTEDHGETCLGCSFNSEYCGHGQRCRRRRRRHRRVKSKLPIDNSKLCLATSTNTSTVDADRTVNNSASNISSGINLLNETSTAATQNIKTSQITTVKTATATTDFENDKRRTNYLNQVPNEILGLIESYVSPSSHSR